MKIKIKPSVRSRENHYRQMTLKASLPYERELDKKRTALINGIAHDLTKLQSTDWVTYTESNFFEPYLVEWYRKMYMGIGKPSGERAVRDFLNIKDDQLPDHWDDALRNWINSELGDRIVLISGTLKKWTIAQIQQYMDANAGVGVEKVVQGVEPYIRERWKDAKMWQIRRIVQTESLTALSEASDIAIKQLHIKYRKTWGISGRNTRPAHQVMDGVTIGQDELFVVNGELLEFPRDIKHGASAGNVINCACFCIRTPISDAGGDLTDEDIIEMI